MIKKYNNIRIFEEIAILELTQGKFAFIDIEDICLINNICWSYAKCKRWNTGYCYGRNGKSIAKLHRIIMGVNNPKILIDHINRNGLDNRKCNLRIVDSSQNMMNSVISNKNTSGERGIHFCNTYKKWVVRLSINNKRLNIGRFDLLEDAIYARNKSIIEYHGAYRYNDRI